MNISDFRKGARSSNQYAWPGGYPVHAITDDGDALCFPCLKRERRTILEAIRGGRGCCDGWRVGGFIINWEDPSLYCNQCGNRIESAYAENRVYDSTCAMCESGDEPGHEH